MRNMYFKMLLIHQLFICIPYIKAKCNAMQNYFFYDKVH